ncbi:MAG TPA: hypothetical protein VJP77_03155 [Planctomycetota bacterium]|nr:hypothetical protein [Planctomycetota bacterium]
MLRGLDPEGDMLRLATWRPEDSLRQRMAAEYFGDSRALIPPDPAEVELDDFRRRDSAVVYLERIADGARVPLVERPDHTLVARVTPGVEYRAIARSERRLPAIRQFVVDSASDAPEVELELPRAGPIPRLTLAVRAADGTDPDTVEAEAFDPYSGALLDRATASRPFDPYGELDPNAPLELELRVPPGPVGVLVYDRVFSGCGNCGYVPSRYALVPLDVAFARGEQRRIEVALARGGHLDVAVRDAEALQAAAVARAQESGVLPGSGRATSSYEVQVSLLLDPSGPATPFALEFDEWLGGRGDLPVKRWAVRSLTSPAPGEYELRAELAGFVFEPVPVVIAEGATTPVELVWRRAP